MYASSAPPEKGMISNQTSCFGSSLSGCPLITINVLLEVIGKIAGVKIPESHRLNEEFAQGLITTIRYDEAGGARICEEVTPDLQCHTVFPLEIGQFCTPAVFDSWIHRIEECTKLKLKSYGCNVQKTSDITRCEGLKGNITQCVHEVGDTPCHYMKVNIFNVGIPLVISVPKNYLPLIKGNKEHIRTAVQGCLNSLDEDAVNTCVPNLYDALVSIGMENPAYRPPSLRNESNSGCLKPYFTGCNLLSRESLQQHIEKEYFVFVNLTFGEANVRWFSEMSGKSGKVTVFGVEEIRTGRKTGYYHYQAKTSCSLKMLSTWKDRITKCVSTAVVDLGMRTPQALTLKRMVDETNKCINKEGPLPCRLETRSDYEQLLSYLMDLIRNHTMVKRDYGSAISFWKRALGLHDVKTDKKCYDSLKYENIKHCAQNMYIYLTHLETSPDSATAMARENDKNQECLSQSLNDCPKPIIEGLMSIFMGAVGHQARKTRDVLGAPPYRHKRLVGIHPVYGGAVTVCHEGPRIILPETTPMYVPEYVPETKTTQRSRIPDYTGGHHTIRVPLEPPHDRTIKHRTGIFIPQTEAPKIEVPGVTYDSFFQIFSRNNIVSPTPQRILPRTIFKVTKPITAKQFTKEIIEEEYAETVTEPTSSPQCSEEEVEAWIEKTQSCSGARIFQLYKARVENCLQIDSSSVFGNVSLCVNEMEPLMAQCGHERIYVFESIMEHLQKMIQQLKAEATQKCQNTAFCLPEKTQLVKCAGPFYDHMKEMKELGKNYQSALDLRSMKDIDQCLTAEMPKCGEKEQKMFKEIAFITYGVEIPESNMTVKGNSEYCYTYTPQQISGTKTIDFRTKAECGPDDVDKWLKTIRKCLDRRIGDLSKQTFNLEELSSKKAFRYIEMCIHVHRVLPCKPSKWEVFEPLFKQLLSNSKQDLMKLVETLKPQIPNVQDAVDCIQELDNENMQKCIPVLFKDMNSMYSDVSAKMDGLESQRCVANALTKCKDKTLKEIDYILKSAMGILHESEKPQKEKSEPENICRPLKAIDIGYRECTSSDMHTELQFIGHCLEKSVNDKPPNSVTLESGIVEAKKCVEKYMLGTCYIADEKLMSQMVRYTFQLMIDNLKKHLSSQDLQCIMSASKTQLSNCASLSYSYTNTLRKGEVVGAMSVVPKIMECMPQNMKGCPQTIGTKATGILGTISRVNYVSVQSTPMRKKQFYQEVRIGRDVYNDAEEFDSNMVIFDNPTEESAEMATTLIEAEVDEDMENSKVRREREVEEDGDTTVETLPDDVDSDETTKDQDPAEYTVIQGKDEINNVTKTDLLALKECNESSFSGWINDYRECFVSSKYKDSGRDLNNIIGRILANIEECMKFSTGKRCFPSWIQVEEFLSEVIFQAKDYAEMYLSEIKRGRGDITDLRCIENLSLDWYINCTTNIFKYLDYLRNHLVSSDGFEEHVKKTALCLQFNYDDCSKMANTKLIEVVEVLLDLRNGTLGNQTVLIQIESAPREKKSIGAKIVDFFKSVAETIAKPFVWLYNTIKNFFHW